MSGSMPFDYATPYSQPPPVRRSRGLIGWLIFVGVAVILFALLRQPRSQSNTIPLSDFYAQMTSGNVAKVAIDEDDIEGSFRTPTNLGGTPILNFRTYLPPGSSGFLTQMLLQASPPIVVQAEPANTFLTGFVLPFIPWILILGFIWFLVSRNARRQAATRPPMPVVIVNPEAK